ncbi:hypothetical protein N9J26_01165 [bacterium]|nr:hypothetical protein [bacterium]
MRASKEQSIDVKFSMKLLILWLVMMSLTACDLYDSPRSHDLEVNYDELKHLGEYINLPYSPRSVKWQVYQAAGRDSSTVSVVFELSDADKADLIENSEIVGSAGGLSFTENEYQWLPTEARQGVSFRSDASGDYYLVGRTIRDVDLFLKKPYIHYTMGDVVLLGGNYVYLSVHAPGS